MNNQDQPQLAMEYQGNLVVLTDPVDLLPYQRDCSSLRPGRASTVIRPRHAADVSQILMQARRDTRRSMCAVAPRCTRAVSIPMPAASCSM